MEFRKEVKTLELLSPSLGFEREVHLIEYRIDPLTKFRSRINPARANRVRQALGDRADMKEVIERSREGCIFCPENIAESTPKFPPELLPGNKEGRIRRGECLLFPNLYPFAEYHAVATLTQRHHLELDQFTHQMITDNIMAAQEYIALVNSKDNKARHAAWLWNHLPPSGASIIHPHVQVMVDRAPTMGMMRVLRRSEEHFRRHGRSYWQELIDTEREIGERYIGENDSLEVVATYAPRGNGEVKLVFKEIGSLAEMGERQTRDFADAILKVLRCYKGMGLDSFNMITYSGPLGERAKHYQMSARIISRPAFKPVYTSDAGPLERLYDVWIIETLPEELAREMRKAFAG